MTSTWALMEFTSAALEEAQIDTMSRARITAQLSTWRRIILSFSLLRASLLNTTAKTLFFQFNYDEMHSFSVP